MRIKKLLILFLPGSLVSLNYPQEIHIRTIPLATVNQGTFYPSLSRGMGNLSFVFEDSLGGPFINPAKASLLSGVNLFVAPVRNSWSNEEGKAVTSSNGTTIYSGALISSFPFGLFLNKENIFTGGSITFQSFSSERKNPGYAFDWVRNGGEIKKDKGDNIHVFGLIGARLPDLKVSIAGSAAWSDYRAIDGVNLLYPGSTDINQKGRAAEYKLGLLCEISEDEQLDAVIGRSIFKSSHEVIYTFPDVWDMPVGYRSEVNKDESKSWVISINYKRLLSDRWKIGAAFTLNRKEHPKIPGYSLANLPRDPGYSSGVNAGAGFLYSGEKSSAGVEYIYEPVTSYTWAEAGENSYFPSFYKTVENYFHFYNHIIRAGIYLRSKYQWLGYSFGVQLHFYKYNLEQNNNIQNAAMHIDENWMETTLTGGLNIRFSRVQLFYSLQLIAGTGIVGAESSPIIFTDQTDKSAGDFLIAPSGPLAVDTVPVFCHQISVRYQL